MTKWVYLFSKQKTEGNESQKNLLGGKGANLAGMCSLGLPVPPGLTITTEACTDYNKNGKVISEEIKKQTLAAVKEIESITGKKFGDKENPLLFSVRSGARVSMPGMMDTVLNLGINDDAVQAVAKKSGNERFAWDSYRRFIQMYADVVMEGVDSDLLEHALEDLKKKRGAKQDNDLNAGDLRELVGTFKTILKEKFNKTFPTDPHEQLWGAVGAVFRSWNNDRATAYRNMYGYSHDWGTAVTVQSMVFGNMGDDCATGVCFTRNPSTGEKVFFGEFLINAQGEDVVAGIRTPAPVNAQSKNDSNKNMKTLEEHMPKAFAELTDIYKKLEGHYKDMQDIEFTVEKQTLYMLQTRNGKRTTAAAVKIALDLVSEGLITKDEALLRVQPNDLNQLLHPRIDPKAKGTTIAKGLNASPGAASGQIVFHSDDAVAWKEKGKATILVRQETSPEDIHGMASAKGILTATGGMTSHAAVVARGMGKTCVSGCGALIIDAKNRQVTVNGKVYKEGEWLTIDGGTGEIFEGNLPTIPASVTGDFAQFMSWADETRKLKVRTNADTPHDAQVAVEFGAQGIGLCRTEHMFFAPERILAVREMIFATTESDRIKALNKLLPFQREDFVGIFTAMNNLPTNIRLLDPPLHEFLPQKESECQELANVLGVKIQDVYHRREQLHEFNPMLGHRGCRLSITYPEIYNMQVRAIIEAAIICEGKGIKVHPEIMIPLVGDTTEYNMLHEQVLAEVNAVFKEKNKQVKYKIGTMIEIPRAAILAGDIAKKAEFFSFGTNDLTQTTYGISRDDGTKFLPEYVNKGVYPCDPFVSLDRFGVGFLMKHASTEGHKSNPHLHVGICGEHGGDPNSVEFCHEIGLDYVSCSPYRVPIARLAAAQAVIKQKKK